MSTSQSIRATFIVDVERNYIRSIIAKTENDGFVRMCFSKKDEELLVEAFKDMLRRNISTFKARFENKEVI